MFYFKGTRKPDFKNISQDVYADYWQEKGIQLRNKLMEREEVFFNWIKSKSRVLSLGCGNSRLLLELKEKKECDVTGVDMVPAVIEELKKNGIKAVVADVTQNNFMLEEINNGINYDYIILSEFLEHITLPEVLINKLKPLTRFFLISIPNSAFYRYRLGLLLKGRFFTQWAKHPAEHLRFWSHIDFLDWLAALGLEVPKVKSSNGPKILKDLWPNLFGHQICYLCQNEAY